MQISHCQHEDQHNKPQLAYATPEDQRMVALHIRAIDTQTQSISTKDTLQTDPAEYG